MLAYELAEVRDGLSRQALFGEQLRAHKVKLDAVWRLLVDGVLRAVLHVGYAFAGQRVGSQIRRSVVLVHPRRLLHALEEGAHSAHVETGLLEILKTHAVGLPLEIARVVELRLDAGRPGPGNGRLGDVGAGPCGEKRHEDRGKR